MAMPLAWQIANIAGWVARSVTCDVRKYRHGAGRHAVDRCAAADAGPAGRDRAVVTGGDIHFEDLHFDYGRAGRTGRRPAVLHGIDLTIAPGRAGRADRPVGRRQVDAGQPAAAFLRPAAGRILIDGQDIAGVTQESLRRRSPW